MFGWRLMPFGAVARAPTLSWVTAPVRRLRAKTCWVVVTGGAGSRSALLLKTCHLPSRAICGRSPPDSPLPSDVRIVLPADGGNWLGGGASRADWLVCAVEVALGISTPLETWPVASTPA